MSEHPPLPLSDKTLALLVAATVVILCGIAYVGFTSRASAKLAERATVAGQTVAERLDKLDRWVEEQKNSPPPHIIVARWIGVGNLEEPRKNAAFYLDHRRGEPVIQIMDGQYRLANFAVTVHDGEVFMQIIQDGKVRRKKLWELTDESDFVREVIPVGQNTINLDD